MNNHPTSDELFAYRDGELGLEKRGLVEAHVLSCNACQSWLDAMSDAEGMLRQQHAEPDAGYFETLTESVMARVAPGAKEGARTSPAREAAPSSAGDAPGVAPRVHPGRRRSLEDEPRGRAPRLPWPAIVSAVSAAAAVLVVVVILFQRQEAWRLAPKPEAAGQKKDAGQEAVSEVPAARAPVEQETPPEPEPAGKSEARANGAEERAPAAISSGQATPADRPEPEIRSQSAADAMPDVALRKEAAAPGAAERARDAAEPQANAMGGGVAGESAFATLATRHGLPLLYDPSIVSSDALLRAEPDLRYVYQTGGAGEDSARVRLYLAEAARARAGDSPDTETFDTIVHHYQRAARLARDPETARVVRERLEDFVSRHAPSR